MSIAIISRFKNERHILFEWIHHHLEEGVDKIFLVDDNSNDDYLFQNPWLGEYINRSWLEIFKSKRLQQNEYNHHLALLKRFTWAVQIDLDEFIFCPLSDCSLMNILDSKFQNIDYIRINWKLFVHRSKVQPKSVIDDNLVTHHQEKDPTSPMGVKCIARTRFLESIRIHKCEFSEKINWVKLPAHNSDIQINHYRTQSDEFLYGVKEQRGSGTHKDSYRKENLKKKSYSAFDKTDFVLRNKRKELIQACNSRPQIKPKIYVNSSWHRSSCE